MVYSFFILAVLLYGAVTDYKRREIPNIVPIVILIIGIFCTKYHFNAILSLTSVAIIFWLTANATKHPIPYGDFKLLCALGFACGLWELLLILLVTGVLTLVMGTISHCPIGRNIPLCTYVAPSYIILLCVKGVVPM